MSQEPVQTALMRTATATKRLNANMELPSARGRLKVFLGYASGVGKTLRMFDEGRRRRDRGQDVIVGALQPEIPKKLRSVLASLEIVPTTNVAGVPIMDVVAIIKRRPQICLVDGLAYDNPPSSRHDHRWQDVEELLSAGISVVGSVNLQYIDDQCQAVERITGRRVSQTIPRVFLNTADEMVVVDAPCENASAELLELREMALLLSADVLDCASQRYLQANGNESGYVTKERLLIYLTPRTSSDTILAAARRSADRFHCSVLTVYVKDSKLSLKDQQALDRILSAVRIAGGTTDVLEGKDSVETLTQYARSHGVTQILVNHQKSRRPWSYWLESPLHRLIRTARGMEVRVIPE